LQLLLQIHFVQNFYNKLSRRIWKKVDWSLTSWGKAPKGFLTETVSRNITLGILKRLIYGTS